MFLTGEYEMRLLVLIVVLFFGSTAVGQQLKEITNSTGMKLVLIHAGSFTMCSLGDALGPGPDNFDVYHEVALSNSYYIGVYEVTQEQYENVTGKNPSKFKAARNPVETVSWEDAVLFCKTLSDLPKEKAGERTYRLPTEAEWEYACRATSTTDYSFGDDVESLAEYAWFKETSGGKTHEVGEKKPNRWGLHDMFGNVFEWCEDWYANYSAVAETDPQGPVVGQKRVIRGGSNIHDSAACRSSSRGICDPAVRHDNVGFRVVLNLPAKQPEPVSSK